MSEFAEECVNSVIPFAAGARLFQQLLNPLRSSGYCVPELNVNDKILSDWAKGI